METTVLDKEKMEAVKELAEIHTAISKGRGNLDDLNKNLDVFVQKQTELTQAAVLDAVSEMRSAVNEVGKSLEELKTYRHDLEGFADTIKKWSNDVLDIQRVVQDWIHAETDRINRAKEDLNAQRTENQAQMLVISDRKKQLEVVQDRLNDEGRKIKSQRAALDSAIKESKVKYNINL